MTRNDGNTLKVWLDRIFKLPPVEERQRISNFWKKILQPYYTSLKDDTYIFYLLFKSNLCIGTVYSIFLWSLYKLNIQYKIGFLNTSLSRENLVTDFSFLFGLTFPFVQFFLIFPFFYVMFMRNVDWKAYDPLWWNEKWKIGRDPLNKIYPLFRKVSLICFVGIFCTWAFPIFIANRLHLHGSEVYLVFTVLILPLLSSVVGWLFFTQGLVILRLKDLKSQK
jgi:hypothetical protein